MPEKHLFEYAVIRVVPKVEREEFLNVGIILYCAEQKFLKMAFELNEERLRLFSSSLELEEVNQRLCAFQQICKGGREGGAIGQLPMSGRFRWLTANRSTVLQTSAVHPGFCENAEEMLRKLVEELVSC